MKPNHYCTDLGELEVGEELGLAAHDAASCALLCEKLVREKLGKKGCCEWQADSHSQKCVFQTRDHKVHEFNREPNTNSWGAYCDFGLYNKGSKS